MPNHLGQKAARFPSQSRQELQFLKLSPVPDVDSPQEGQNLAGNLFH